MKKFQLCVNKFTKKLMNRLKCLNQRLILKIVLLKVISICLIVYYMQQSDDEVPKVMSEEHTKFLYHTNECKIPSLDPFSPEVMKLYQRLEYKKCNELDPLTYIARDKKMTNLLMINETILSEYLMLMQSGVECCYHRISRSGTGAEADNEFTLSDCINFQSGHELSSPEDEFIIVKCFGIFRILNFIKTNIYTNAHAIVIPKVKIDTENDQKPPNVLLIGIDSISRLNLIRFLPETFKFVKSNGWYDMKVFNKVGMNTFPNLNAILNGKNYELIERDCDYRKVGEFEKCRFIWNDFKDANYVTAFAEDMTTIHTFNYLQPGFINQPTDHYLRPFCLAAEKNIEIDWNWMGLVTCLGYQHYADHIYQYALDFAITYKNQPHFGLFWSSTMSHDELNHPSEYDAQLQHYLSDLKAHQALNNTILVFFSDHGMRFGEVRQLYTGWLEERLPFLYFSLPESFKRKYPEFDRNLRINQDRLISPFDIHVTLKHILKLSGNFDGNLEAAACPSCQSLFHEIPHNRSCFDAGITREWCACNGFTSINKKSSKVERIAKFAIDKLNRDLKTFENCAKLKLNKILTAGVSSNNFEFLISFEVLPSYGQMEATVRCSSNDCKENLEVVGGISRINRYGDQSKCIKDKVMRQYCYCN